MLSRIKALFAKRKTPLPDFHDAELGVLTGDSGLWSRVITRNEKVIPFMVAGTQMAPDSGLLDQVREIVHKFSEVESTGLEFLRSELADILREELPDFRSIKFTFHCLTFLWNDKPDVFHLEWFSDGEDDCIWRVNFEDGKPKEAGFED